MLEVHISEEEYVHFEVIGHASEAEVIRAKSNLKRFGQEIKDVVDEEEDTPEEDPKIAERPGRLEHNVEGRRSANPDRVLQQKHILERMRHVPTNVQYFPYLCLKACIYDRQSTVE